MIRRDYILRMIEEFIQALARIKALKSDRRQGEAGQLLDEQFSKLVGAGAEAVAQLSEAELLARLMQEYSTHVVRSKTLLLASMLKEAGDLAASGGIADQARSCYLKGLHLLLNVMLERDVQEFPDFVPGVDAFVIALQDSPLPPHTQALLMRHYEHTGQFAKAEDALFALLDAAPADSDVVKLGIAFFERLKGQSDAALNAGNLPRSELEESLAELRSRPR